MDAQYEDNDDEQGPIEAEIAVTDIAEHKVCL
jgi:hypothetical protein